MAAALLTDALLAHAAATPTKPFVHFVTQNDTSILTYGELISEAGRFAQLCAAHGAVTGDNVLISLKTSRDLITAFFGAMLAGCCPSMMPFPSVKQDAARFWSSHNALFRHLGGGLIITYPDNIPAIAQNIDAGLVTPIAAHAAHTLTAGDAPCLPPPSRHDLACLQHSSGTTGLKKGVPLTFGQIADHVATYAAAIGMTGDAVIASWLPLYHDMGFIACLLMPASLGATIVMLDPFEWSVSPVSLLHAMHRYQAGFAWLPNFAFNHLVNAIPDDRARVDLGHVTALINCSEPCKPGTFDLFARRFAAWGIRPDQLQVCYAMAEAVFAVTQTRVGALPCTTRPITLPDAQDSDTTPLLLSAGRPLPGIALRIVAGKAGDAAPEGQLGEIGLAGPGIFQGYHKSEPRDPAIFRGGFYLTGDIGLLRDGELYVLGRRKDLIIVCGRNFFAHDIESLVNENAGVKPGRVVALGLYNQALGSEDLVIVAERDPTVAEDRALRREIRLSLQACLGLVPKKIHFVEEGWLIKSTSGKLSRTENLAKYRRDL